MSPSLNLERRGPVATIRIQRPPLNILDLKTLERLGVLLEEVANDSGIQVLVLRGSGTRAFSAGVAVEDHTADKVPQMLRIFHGALRELLHLPAASVAVVQGHCLGGGLELAAACDFVVAEPAATFGQPEIKLGCYPPFAAALYPTLMGTAATVELLLTGETISTDRAADLGLVTHRAGAADIDATLETLVESLTRYSRSVTRITLEAVRGARSKDFERALEISERLYLEKLLQTEDMNEGIDAFLAKRSPLWNHRLPES